MTGITLHVSDWSKTVYSSSLAPSNRDAAAASLHTPSITAIAISLRAHTHAHTLIQSGIHS